jgi:hypothetical protein
MEEIINLASKYGFPGMIVLGIGWMYWKERLFSNSREKAHREERGSYEEGHTIERKQWKDLAERQISSDEKQQAALVDVINRNNDALTGVREAINRRE